MLLLLRILACTTSDPVAPTPKAPAPPPEVEDAPPPTRTWPLPETPKDCCALELFVPSSGYNLRIWFDGRITQQWGDEEPSPLEPYDVDLSVHPKERGPFVAQEQATWAAELSKPWVNPELRVEKLPNHRVYDPEPMVLRTRKGKRVITLEIVADLDYRPSFGRLEPAWTALASQLWRPQI